MKLDSLNPITVTCIRYMLRIGLDLSMLYFNSAFKGIFLKIIVFMRSQKRLSWSLKQYFVIRCTDWESLGYVIKTIWEKIAWVIRWNLFIWICTRNHWWDKFSRYINNTGHLSLLSCLHFDKKWCVILHKTRRLEQRTDASFVWSLFITSIVINHTIMASSSSSPSSSLLHSS